MEPLGDDASDYGGEVHVTLSNGTTVSNAVNAPIGRGSETPLPQDMLETKFMDCACASLTNQGATEVFQLLMNLDDLPDMNARPAQSKPQHAKPKERKK